MKRRTAFSSVRRFNPLGYFFAPVICIPLFQRFPSFRSAGRAELFLRLNNPSSLGLEELHANCIAVAMQRLAVGHSRRGTKLSGAQPERQLFVLLPASRAHHASAA